MRSTRKLNKIMIPIAGAGIGIIGGGFLSKIPQLQGNPTIRSVVKVAGGAFIAIQKGKIAQSVGMGLAASGLVDLVDSFIMGPANGNGNGNGNGVGLFSPTDQVHRITGRGSGMGDAGRTTYNEPSRSRSNSFNGERTM